MAPSTAQRGRFLPEVTTAADTDPVLVERTLPGARGQMKESGHFLLQMVNNEPAKIHLK